MVLIDLDNDLYEKLKAKAKNDKIEYPSIKNCLNKLMKEKLEEK